MVIEVSRHNGINSNRFPKSIKYTEGRYAIPDIFKCPQIAEGVLLRLVLSVLAKDGLSNH